MKKKISFFFSKNFQFLAVKFPIYLNRRVFVMLCLSAAFHLDQLMLMMHGLNCQKAVKRANCFSI